MRGRWNRVRWPVKTWIVGWSLAALMIVGFLGLVLTPGSMNSKSLGRSVQWEFDDNHYSSEPRCEKLASGDWRCGVAHQARKPDGYYLVTPSEWGGWDATRLGPSDTSFGRGAPRTLSGWVTLDESIPITAVDDDSS